ncbi:aldehyde dehydrogenase [Microbacterium sp. CJ77]|uniref:aldehyde dehydrogenase family protein n=1 Tax=Microbacterium sp. CJ77 TaxID=2079201 RepID=UPI000CD95398|nr:aldehyde dehydrogenase family protein [Microbacterium sp. CJ77]
MTIPEAPPRTALARHRDAAARLPYRHVDDVFIGGEYVAAETGERQDVIDPATAEAWGSVPVASDRDVDRAVRAARAAFPGWAGLAPGERAARMRAWADAIERRSDPLAVTNSLENGSPLAETSGQAANAAGIIRYFAGLADILEREDVRVAPLDPTQATTVRREPIGVCALIAPWNFPINLVVIKLAPALIAGCTVVVKPASPTPLSIRFLLDAAVEAGIPAGVVNLVTGDARVGDRLVRHPDVDKVAFTGSTPVGRRIAAACGELLRPVTLELGGKSAAIVLPDADVAHLQRVLIRSCLRNTGQTCYISTRLIVTPERYEEVVDAVAATVSAAVQGDPLDPATVFGPSATRAQQGIVRDYIRSGIAEGARVVTGGDVEPAIAEGFFVTPTVFADVTAEMAIAREEIFGPVLSIMPARDVDEAVALANATPFGLGGIVFGQNEDRAFEVATRVDTGSIGINFFGSNHAAPFGGRRDSGLGVEYGVEGLNAYLTYQSVHRRVRA